MCASTFPDLPVGWNNVRLGFALAVFTLLACKKPDVATLEPYRAEMCACKDVACANTVFDRWGKALGKFLDVDDAAEKQIMAISKGVNDCRDKLMMDAALPGRSK
jgi:hypothetical protein